MDKDRIAGSAKDFAGKVESTVGDIAGDAKTQASGRAREAAGTVQNLYGQAKDAARDAGDAAMNYARDAYENSGDTLRDGSQAVAQKGAGQSARGAFGRRRYRFCAGDADDAPAAPPAAVALALLQLSEQITAKEVRSLSRKRERDNVCGQTAVPSRHHGNLSNWGRPSQMSSQGAFEPTKI